MRKISVQFWVGALSVVVASACGVTPENPDIVDPPAKGPDIRLDVPDIPGGGTDPICTVPIVPTDPVRPAEILDATTMALVAARMPCIADPALLALFESTDTMWYDKFSIIPGYQDSSGDNVTFPVGMRPNTINPNLIVDGGHEKFFSDVGNFHFPFGRPIGSPDGSAAVVDFWNVPRDAGGDLVPVAWWFRAPNNFTWRYEWIFPKGTVLGELLFIIDDAGDWYPFEVRTRTRELTGWTVDVYRPFPEAGQLAEALEKKRQEQTDWTEDGEITALVAHLRDDTSLASAQLDAPLFPTVFPTIDGAEDVLPGLTDPQILRELLLEHPFSSSRGLAWKSSGGLTAYAATTDASFHIVPEDYNAGFLAVDEQTCSRCHVDAGHPFKDYHGFVYLYGEVWGADETFTWHPFTTSEFVDSNGNVQNFNYNNREMRSDFVAPGLVEEIDPGAQDPQIYQRLMQDWSDYSY